MRPLTAVRSTLVSIEESMHALKLAQNEVILGMQ